MTLKIGPVMDRASVKLAVMLHPDAHDALADYAIIHAREFGREIPLAELAALMIERFLHSDAAFKRARKTIDKKVAAKE
ncbi:MAG: DUF2274 domain-containing protein [Parvularculaceae bacterium]|nr:DUF2274 domain-containing protein [Parvularculaceae bacterium]